MIAQSSLFSFSKLNSAFSASVSRFCTAAAMAGVASAISLGIASPAMAGTLVKDDSGFVTGISRLEVGNDFFDVNFFADSFDSLQEEGVVFDFDLVSASPSLFGQAIVDALGQEGSLGVGGRDDQVASSDRFFLPFGQANPFRGRDVVRVVFDQDLSLSRDIVNPRGLVFTDITRDGGGATRYAQVVRSEMPQEVPTASMLPAVLTVAAAAFSKRKLLKSEDV